jgi:hypothetical protein
MSGARMRPVPMISRRPALAASASLLMFSLGLVLAACSTTGPSVATPTTAATLAPSPTIAVTASPVASVGPAVSPTPTPITGTRPCDPASLSAVIKSWDSGAGHRTATVELTSNGKSDCTLHALAKPQLVGGNGAVLIDGTGTSSSTVLTLHYYDVVSTMVDVDNYCGAAPVAPVTVAFVFPGPEGRVVATPLSPTDTSGVPPCMGTNPGSIDMHPFGP